MKTELNRIMSKMFPQDLALIYCASEPMTHSDVSLILWIDHAVFDAQVGQDLVHENGVVPAHPRRLFEARLQATTDLDGLAPQEVAPREVGLQPWLEEREGAVRGD